MQRLKRKFRLIAFNDSTFEEVWAVRISKLNIILLWISLLLIFLVISFAIVAFTPVRTFIPDFPDENQRNNIIANAEKLDSLDYQLKVYEQYILNLKTIINGGEPNNYEDRIDTASINYTANIVPNDSSPESEYFEGYNGVPMDLVAFERPENEMSLSSIHFFNPVKGFVTNFFNPANNHYGTDIVADANEIVKACLGGTVILSSWTLETGWVIQIQHEHELISIYKHNAEILKEIGSHVEAGEVIAIIGNSGELTTGPHLHFELWHRGVPLNPEDYITF